MHVRFNAFLMLIRVFVYVNVYVFAWVYNCFLFKQAFLFTFDVRLHVKVMF